MIAPLSGSTSSSATMSGVASSSSISWILSGLSPLGSARSVRRDSSSESTSAPVTAQSSSTYASSVVGWDKASGTATPPARQMPHCAATKRNPGGIKIAMRSPRSEGQIGRAVSAPFRSQRSGDPGGRVEQVTVGVGARLVDDRGPVPVGPGTGEEGRGSERGSSSQALEGADLEELVVAIGLIRRLDLEALRCLVRVFAPRCHSLAVPRRCRRRRQGSPGAR